MLWGVCVCMCVCLCEMCACLCMGHGTCTYSPYILLTSHTCAHSSHHTHVRTHHITHMYTLLTSHTCTHSSHHTHMQKIETDEKVKGPQPKEVSHDDLEMCRSDLEGIIRSQVHLKQPGKCACLIGYRLCVK